MSNELEQLIDRIQFLTKKTLDDIAEEIGYSRPHLSNAKKKADNKKLVGILKNKYADILQNVTSVGHLEEPESPYKTKKAPTVKDVDAFLVTNQIRQEALLQTILEFLAEIGGGVLDRSSMALLGDLQKRVEEKETELREGLGRTA